MRDVKTSLLSAERIVIGGIRRLDRD
jgi:hypothetical protein